jgi:hypothetical protein
MMRFACFSCVFLLTTGCVDTLSPDYVSYEDIRFQSFQGMTMAQFMQTTMTTPSDYFETNNERIFIVEKPHLGTPYSCRMQVATVSNGTQSGADAWRIVRITRQGGCGHV